MSNIGFVGLGIMGKPMALNLINAGHSLYVLERNRQSKELGQSGATVCKTISDIAAESDIIITMLPDSPQVLDVVKGEDGILASIKKNSLFIDMSTISPTVSKEVYGLMTEKSVEALDAPVSGGQIGAENGTLSVMVGGTKEAFERALPVLKVMGKNVVHIGEAGSGQMTKACNQIIVGITIEAVAEAFTLAQKAGLNLSRLREALLGGFAQSRILDLHGMRILEKNFKPGFKVRLHRKDLNIALQEGKNLSVPLSCSALVASNMDSLIAQSHGDLDHSSLYLLQKELSAIL